MTTKTAILAAAFVLSAAASPVLNNPTFASFVQPESNGNAVVAAAPEGNNNAIVGAAEGNNNSVVASGPEGDSATIVSG